MACDLTAGRALPCKDAIGGIKEILLCNFSDVIYGAVTAGAIADIDSDTTFYRWELTRNSGSLVQTVQSNLENGTVYFDQVVTIVSPKMEAAVSAEIARIAQARCSAIVRDVNDNWHIMGLTGGVEVTGGDASTGTAKADRNGYTLTLSAEEKSLAPFGMDLSNATIVSALTGTVTITPSY